MGYSYLANDISMNDMLNNKIIFVLKLYNCYCCIYLLYAYCLLIS